MLKATKLAFAATLVAGSCGLAMAQGAGADKTEGSEAGRGRPALVQPPQPGTSGAQSSGNAMQEKNTKMQEKNTNLNSGQETGTAKDSAGPGQMRQQTK
jgi:hypothetical protein